MLLIVVVLLLGALQCKASALSPMKLFRVGRFLSVAIAVMAMSACERDVLRQRVLPSPDGSILADWYQLADGGGAGASADLVQLRKRGERFSLRDDYVFEGWPGEVLKISWKNNSELEIVYPMTADVRRSESHWDRVSITYRGDPQLKERGY
jgi:hypothetical protein